MDLNDYFKNEEKDVLLGKINVNIDNSDTAERESSCRATIITDTLQAYTDLFNKKMYKSSYPQQKPSTTPSQPKKIPYPYPPRKNGKNTFIKELFNKKLYGLSSSSQPLTHQQ